jgi:peptide/nickel transport system substrate-binding protein
MREYNTPAINHLFSSLNLPRYWYLLSLLLICSCQKKQDIDPTTVFRYNEHANITSLDPAFAKDQRNIWACNLIYNSLVKLDADLNIVPDLAEGWEISEDGLTYSFKLRDDVFFHDDLRDSAFAKAEKLKATDVKYSLERLRDPELAAPGAWTMKYINEITIIDEQQIQLRLSQPYPAFLGVLSMKYCSILPASSAGSDLRKTPRGTGPFYLKRWEENVKMVLRRNDAYFETDESGQQLPYLEAVAITFKSDKQSEFLEFIQGNLDFINALDTSYKDELLTSSGELKAKYQDEIKFQKLSFLNTEYIGFNLNSSNQAIKTPSFRKALNLGFDRKKMMKFLRNNIGIPGNYGFIPLGLPGGGLNDGFGYDPTEAKRLIDQYVKESSDKTPAISLTTSANYLDLMEFIQKELEKLGIDVDIEVMPPSTLRQARKAGQLEAFRSSWIADYPDAENYLALFHSRNQTPAGSNYTFYQNTLFDSLYDLARDLDYNKRIGLYKKMDSLIIADAPIIPLYYDQSVRFIQNNVQGLKGNATNTLDLTRVKKVQS